MADSSFPSRRSSTASRRTLQRRSSRLSQNEDLIDIFSDANAADFMPVVDGFRPTSTLLSGAPTGTSSPPRPGTPQLPPRAASPPRASEYLKKRIAGQERQSSHRSSLSGPQRDSFMQRAPSVSNASEASPRPLSTVSTLSTASESPYTPAGPSHAYAAYPQVSSLNRHASTSTVQTQNRPYTGPSRPTHPYAMYPQIPSTQEPEQADSFADPGDIANVGFPGLGQSYARVRAADGEDADDLIGPDGHTEQLPPYTRFPNDMPAKTRNELRESTTPLMAAAIPVPVNDSEESLTDPTPAASLLDNDDGARINTAAARAAGDDDRSRAQRLKEQGLKRFAQVPVWVWLVMVVLLCIVAAALGAAVGTFFAKHGPPKNDNGDGDASGGYSVDSNPEITTSPDPKNAGTYPHATIWETVTTTLIDATPLTTTPSGFPTLAAPASYAVPLSAPSEFDTCVEPPGNVSWQCSPDAYLSLRINKTDSGTPPAPLVQVVAEFPKNAPLLYGAQPPSMKGPAVATLVQDLQEPKDVNGPGPAYFFQQLVDKLVIIKDSDMPYSVVNKHQKFQRRQHESWRSWFQRREEGENFADDGADNDIDRFLEEQESLPLDTAFNDLEARGDLSPNGLHPVLTGDTVWFCFWNKTILEGFLYMTKPHTPDGADSSYLASEAAATLVSDHDMTAAASSTASPIIRRGNELSASVGGQIPTPAPYFNYQLKIEERRGSPGMPTPYCQKMFANQDGQIVPFTAPSVGPNWFNISEKQPISQGSLGGTNSKRFITVRQLPVDGSCKCIWRCE